MKEFFLNTYLFFVSAIPKFLYLIFTVSIITAYLKFPEKTKKILIWSAAGMIMYIAFVTIYVMLAFHYTIPMFELGEYLVQAGRLKTVNSYSISNLLLTYLLIFIFSVPFFILRKAKQFAPEDKLAALYAFSSTGLGILTVALRIVYKPGSSVYIFSASMLSVLIIAIFLGIVLMLFKRKKRFLLGPSLILASGLIFFFGFDLINQHFDLFSIP